MVRTVHGINTDIPFSSDRTVTTNMIHVTKMQTFLKQTNKKLHFTSTNVILEMSMHHYPASAS